MDKNRFSYKMSVMLMLLLAAFQFCLTSCSDDDDANGGQPEITAVRVPDPAKADSTFVKAGPGQMIAIIGNNLGNTLKVYINDQEVYFNPTMNTDHSIIVTIPSEEDGFKLTAFDSNLKDEIRVETTHGTAVYSFKITAPYPQMQRISATYPRNAGDKLTVYGLNLVDVEKVYFTDVEGEELDTTVWKDVPGNHVDAAYEYVSQNHDVNPDTKAYETASVLSVTVPDGAPEKGALVVECAAGVSYLSYYRLPGKPVILTCSNDMPQVGETLVITGREFVQVEKVMYCDVTLTSDQFTVSESEDTIYVPFTQKPVDCSNATLTVVTPGGEVSQGSFYDTTTLVTSFDDGATDNGWSPNASYVDSGTADGIYAYINVPTEYQQWWGTMIYFRKDWSGNSFLFSDNIPATATADELYFTMNVYDAGDYNNGSFWGYLRYMIQPFGDAENQYDNFAWEDYDTQLGSFPDGPVLQDINGKNHKNKWYRAVVPLSKFACYAGKTMADIRTTGLNQFRIQSVNQSITSGKIDVKFDNIRVIYIPSK